MKYLIVYTSTQILSVGTISTSNAIMTANNVLVTEDKDSAVAYFTTLGIATQMLEDYELVSDIDLEE